MSYITFEEEGSWEEYRQRQFSDCDGENDSFVLEYDYEYDCYYDPDTGDILGCSDVDIETFADTFAEKMDNSDMSDGGDCSDDPNDPDGSDNPNITSNTSVFTDDDYDRMEDIVDNVLVNVEEKKKAVSSSRCELQ